MKQLKRINHTERVRRLQERVQEKNARVIICNNPETYTLVDLGIELDKAVRRLRNRAFTSIPPQEAIPVFETINHSLILLEEATAKAAELTDMNFYRTPRTIMRLRKQMGMDVPGESESVLKIADAK